MSSSIALVLLATPKLHAKQHHSVNKSGGSRLTLTGLSDQETVATGSRGWICRRLNVPVAFCLSISSTFCAETTMISPVAGIEIPGNERSWLSQKRYAAGPLASIIAYRTILQQGRSRRFSFGEMCGKHQACRRRLRARHVNQVHG